MSTWLTDILVDVTFDVVSLTVSAVFTDGHTEDWPLMDRACIRILEAILDDLRQSVLSPSSSAPPAPAPAPPSPVPPVFKKPAKHKKQRSLLMQLVQYITSFLRIIMHVNTLRQVSHPKQFPSQPIALRGPATAAANTSVSAIRGGCDV
jgi:hypothetical protein